MDVISLSAFRAMAAGKMNKGSVVVGTDEKTHAQKLVKVENGRMSGRRIAVQASDNQTVRQVFYDVIVDDLSKNFGTRHGAAVSDFVSELHQRLLGGDNATRELLRGDDLQKTLDSFDAFVAQQKRLERREIRQQTREAEKKAQGEKFLDAGDIRISEELDRIRYDQFDAKVRNPKAEGPRSNSALVKDVIDDLVANGGKTRAFDRKLSISSQSFKRIITQRSATVAQRALTLMEDMADTRFPLTSRNAVVMAVEQIRREERAVLAQQKAAPLKGDEAELAKLLTLCSVRDIKAFAAAHGNWKGGIIFDLVDSLKFLARSPGKTLHDAFSIPLDRSGKTKVDVELTCHDDNSLSAKIHGHTINLPMTAYQMVRNINLALPRTVDKPDAAFLKGMDDNGGLEADKAGWQGDLTRWAFGGVSEQNPHALRIDQDAYVRRFENMMSELCERNNKHPSLWGGAPHYGNRLPTLKTDDRRISFLFWRNRSEQFLRNYYNDRIRDGERSGNPAKAWFWRKVASAANVPLTAGTEGRDGTGDTCFERVMLHLQGLRRFAQHANWVLGEFEPKTPNESQDECIKRGIKAFNQISKFQLHRTYNGETFSRGELVDTLRTALRDHYLAFAWACKHNDLDGFFAKLSEGACFQGCMGCLNQYMDAQEVLRDQDTQTQLKQWADSEKANAAVLEGAETVQQAEKDDKLSAAPAENDARSMEAYMTNEIRTIIRSHGEGNALQPKVWTWNEIQPLVKERCDQAFQKRIAKRQKAFDEQNELLVKMRKSLAPIAQWKAQNLDGKSPEEQKAIIDKLAPNSRNQMLSYEKNRATMERKARLVKELKDDLEKAKTDSQLKLIVGFNDDYTPIYVSYDDPNFWAEARKALEEAHIVKGDTKTEYLYGDNRLFLNPQTRVKMGVDGKIVPWDPNVHGTQFIESQGENGVVWKSREGWIVVSPAVNPDSNLPSFDGDIEIRQGDIRLRPQD